MDAQVWRKGRKSLEATSPKCYCKHHSVFFKPLLSHQWTPSNIKQIPLQHLSWVKRKQKKKPTIKKLHNSGGVENWLLSSEGNSILLYILRTKRLYRDITEPALKSLIWEKQFEQPCTSVLAYLTCQEAEESSILFCVTRGVVDC